MTSLVAGVGFKAIAGHALSRVGSFLGSLNVWQLGCLALGIFSVIQHFAIAADHHHIAKVEAHDAATGALLKTALGNEQTLKTALNSQTAKVNALAAETARQQNIAAKALETAAQRANEARVVSDRLNASSETLKSAQACEPSDTLKAQWQ